MTEYSLVTLDPTIVRHRSQPTRRQPEAFTTRQDRHAVEQGVDLSSVRPSEEVDGSFARFSSGGSNPLVRAATPLLVLAGRLREQITEVDLRRLHEQCSQELSRFHVQAVRAGVPPDDVGAAGFTLCSLIDEAVLSTPWGARSHWAARSLLLTYHDESSGWEEILHVVGSARSDPTRYRALLEFLYLCLAIGFENDERLAQEGSDGLRAIRQDLFACLQGLQEGTETDLSPQWRGIEDRPRAVSRIAPLPVAAAAGMALLVGVFVFSSTSLSKRAEPLNAMLAQVGREPFQSLTPAPEAVPDPPRAAQPPQAPEPGLRDLLAAQIAQGLVHVEDTSGGRLIMILTVSDLFASGSARINPRYAQLIDQVGAAMEQIPGHYRVTGHTDDLPVHSLRFPDNFALSRERAQQVMSLLKNRIRDPGRLDFEGVGATEPRYQPQGAPVNRARNRRVEIALI